MNYNAEKNSVKTARLTVIAVSVVLIIAIALFAVLNFTPRLGSSEMQEKLTIISNIKASKALGDDGTNPKGYRYAASYLSDFGIGNFNGDKFTGVENCIQSYYYQEPAPADTLAYLTAEMFLNQYYDKINLDDETAVTDALLACYMRSIGDKYAYYRTPEEWQAYLSQLNGEGEKVVGIGVNIIVDYNENTILVNSTVSGSPAEAAGILSGDYIVGADSVTAEKDGAEAVLNAIKGEAGTAVKITVERGDKTLEFSIVRAEFESPESSIYYGYLDPNTAEISPTSGEMGYVLIVDFLGDSSSSGVNNTLEMFKSAVDALVQNGVRGIVFDVRYNPGGLLNLVVQMTDYLLPDGNTIITESDRSGTVSEFKGSDGHSLDIPFVVLCNEYSASAAEIFCSAVKDYASEEMGRLVNASVVGKTTYGKGIVQNTWMMKDGSALTFTTSYYNPPSGINFHGQGVEPNVTEKDENKQLQAAADELNRLIEDENAAAYIGAAA